MSYASLRIPALVLCGTLVAAASVRGQSQELTLERALQGVETANLSVLVSRETVSQAEETARLAQSPLFPLFSVNVNQTRSNRGFSSNTSSTTSTGISNNFDAGLYGTLALLDLQQHSNLRAARQAIVAARRDYGSTVQSVMASIAALYFEHARNLAADTVIDANIERANVLLTLAKNQLEAGVATQIDVTRAETALVTQQQAKLQQAIVITSSELRLKRLLNIDLAAAIVLDSFSVRRDLDEAVEKIPLDSVLEQRADYQSALARREQLRLLRKAAGNERLPTLDVFAQGGRNGRVAFDGEDDTFWSTGVRVSVPVFDGNRIRANERSADSRLRQQEFQLADLRNEIDSELRIAVQTTRSQIAQIAVAEKSLALAAEELRLARVRYEQGVADNRELIDAENSYTSASFNLVNAQYNYSVARVELARVRGDVRLVLSETAPPAAPTAPAPAPAAK